MKKQTTDELTATQKLMLECREDGYKEAISDVEKIIDKLEWIGKVRLKAEIARLHHSQQKSSRVEKLDEMPDYETANEVRGSSLLPKQKHSVSHSADTNVKGERK